MIFKDQTEALLDSRSEVYVMSLTFTFKLGLKVWQTNIGVKRIDGITPEIYEMIVSTFSVSHKDDRETFFEESLFLADVQPDIVLGM